MASLAHPARLGRRLVWLAIGHPVALVTAAIGAALAARIGWSLRRVLAVAAVLDLGFGALAARSGTTPARLFTLWSSACRFRRRWPSLLMRAGLTGDRNLRLVESTDDAVTGAAAEVALRAGAGVPSLGLVPRLRLPATVSWDLAPGLHEVDADALATVDGRIMRASVGRRPALPTLDIEFAAEVPTHSSMDL